MLKYIKRVKLILDIIKKVIIKELEKMQEQQVIKNKQQLYNEDKTIIFKRHKKSINKTQLLE